MERDEALQRLSEKMRTPSERAAMDFFANYGALVDPILGGALAVFNQIRLARSKQEADALLLDWANRTNDSIKTVEAMVNRLHQMPDEVSMAELLTEVLGADAAISLIRNKGSTVAILLNPATMEELQAHARRGLLQLQATHCQANLGANNRIGEHIEDQKRPYGVGQGFVVCVGRPTNYSITAPTLT